MNARFIVIVIFFCRLCDKKKCELKKKNKGAVTSSDEPGRIGVKKIKKGLIIEGLRELLRAKSDVVLPHLVPSLIAEPVTIFHIKALSMLAQDMGEQFRIYITPIFNAVLKGALHNSGAYNMQQQQQQQQSVKQEETENDEKENNDTNVNININIDILENGTQALIRGVTDNGVSIFMTEIREKLHGALNPYEKAMTCKILSGFVKNSKTEFEDQIDSLIASVLDLMINDNIYVRQCAWECLRDIMHKIPEIELGSHIEWFRKCIYKITHPDFGPTLKQIPGFCIDKVKNKTNKFLNTNIKL